MSVTTSQTEKLLRENRTFSLLGFSMLLNRLKTRYSSNPSPSTLKACADEINVFIKKFEKVMTNDYAIISKL